MSEWPKMSFPKTPPEAVFLRFGRWSTRSHNHMSGTKEAGVSVYRAKLVDGVVVLDDVISSQLYGEGRCIFPVTGRVVGYGSEDEPLLRAIKFLSYAVDVESIPSEVKK